MKMKSHSNEFILELIPTPCPRPRVTKSGVTYYPAKYTAFKKEAKALLKKFNFTPLNGPLKLEVIFNMPIPKSTSKKKTEELVDSWHIKRPDTDNLMKSVKDAAEGFLYNDDSQICWEVGKKIYSKNPSIIIKIEELK